MADLYEEQAVKRGKCESCGDIEWLFKHNDKLLCGMCKQDTQLIETTTTSKPHLTIMEDGLVEKMWRSGEAMMRNPIKKPSTTKE